MLEGDSEEIYDPIFAIGSVVQLRSGGPLLTAKRTYKNGEVQVLYYNSVSGQLEQYLVHQCCLKSANTAPMVPEGAERLRQTSVAKGL